MENEPAKGDTTDSPNLSRRGFIAGAAALLAGVSAKEAEAKIPDNVVPVRDLSQAQARGLLASINLDTLAVMLMLESGGDPNARNPKSNVLGAFQFISSTGESVGLSPNERSDPYLSMLGAARLQRQSNEYLRANLGREPQPYEVYLAHQQGQAGAVALIRGGNRNAIEVLDSLPNVGSGVARQAIVNNGGRSDMTSAQFVEVVREFYNKSATSAYSAPAGKKWVAHVIEHHELEKGFLENDPYFSRKKQREHGRKHVDNPESDLRTYHDMLDYVLGNPNSPFAKQFPMLTGVVDRVWNGNPNASPTHTPPKKESFNWLDRMINGKKPQNPQR